MSSLPLPVKLPCWVRAIYSWSGEEKKDLGFVEGDLIEVINTGDGNWWNGRLKRNKMVGAFPCNFVEYLNPHDSSGVRAFEQPTIQDDNVGSSENLVAQESNFNMSPVPNRLSETQNGLMKGQYSPNTDGQGYYEEYIQEDINSYDRNNAQNYHNPAQYNMQHGRNSGTQLYNNPNGSMSTLQAETNEQYYQQQDHRQSQSYEKRRSHDYQNPSQRLSYQQQRDYQSSRLYRHNDGYGDSHSRQNSIFSYDNRSEMGAFRGSVNSRHGGNIASMGPPPVPPQHTVSVRRPHDISDRKDSGNSFNTLKKRSGSYDNRTPSPLRNAMDDVLNSLDNLELASSAASSPMKSTQQLVHPEPYNSTKPSSSMAGFGHARSQSYHPANTKLSIDLDSSPIPKSKLEPPENHQFHLRAKSMIIDEPPKSKFGGNPSIRPSATGSDTDSDDIPFDPNSFSTSKQTNLKSVANSNHSKNDLDLLVSRNGTCHSTSTVNTASSSVASQATTPTTISEVSATSAGSFSRHQKDAYYRMESGTNSAAGLNVHDANEVPVDLPTNTRSSAQKQDAKKSMRLKKSTGFLKKLFNGSSKSNNDSGKTSRPGTSLGFISGRKSVSSAREPAQYDSATLQLSKTRGGAGSGSVRSNRSASSASVRDTLRKVSGKAFNSRSAFSSLDFHHSTKSNTSVGISRHNDIESLSHKASRSGSRSASRSGMHETARWIEIHRNVHRTNTLTRNEKEQRASRQQFDGSRVLKPIEALKHNVFGNETADGGYVKDDGPLGYRLEEKDYSLVDNKIFSMNSWPYFTPAELARSFINKNIRSPLDQLRAAFDFCATKLRWEAGVDDDDDDDEYDYRNNRAVYDEYGNEVYNPAQKADIGALSRVMKTRRASTLDIAHTFKQICDVLGIYCEVIPGYLKGIGEIWLNPGIPRPNHYWNAVLIDDQWRMIDASIANPSFPTRHIYTRCDERLPEFFYFLTRPTELLYTHVPYDVTNEHVYPPLSHENAIALPLAGPSAFMFNLDLDEFSTSLTRLEGLEVAEIVMAVPPEAEILAEVVAGNFPAGSAGTLVLGNALDQRETKPALSQVFWDDKTGERYCRIKAALPHHQRQGALNIYVGSRGVLQSITKNVLSLAYSIPLVHTGENPLFNFVIRHPTPHSDKQDIYINEPQCRDLVCGNMYVFSMRQHFSRPYEPKNKSRANNNTTLTRGRSVDLKRMKSNASSLSNLGVYGNSSRYNLMTLNGVGGSAFNNEAPNIESLMAQSRNQSYPTRVKMALQTPHGKILKLNKTEVFADGSGLFEGTARCNEPGIWRGLILSDTGNAWSVFAEWNCA